MERLAHLLCELFVRLQTAGLTNGDSCEFPLTQNDLGEATGLSSVHVNRTLGELREANLIVLKDRTLRITVSPGARRRSVARRARPGPPRVCVPVDIVALKRHAMFNANYLHLNREGRHLDANFR